MKSDTDQILRRCAQIADRLSLALVPGGNLPFDSMQSVDWVPDEHVDLMRAYCDGQGSAGAATNEVSALATTLQTTLDQGSAEQLPERLRTAFTTAAVASALFVNSPISAGRPAGWQSWRMSCLAREDPRRFGMPPFAVFEYFDAHDFVYWLLDIPMIHYNRGGVEQLAPDRSFQELLQSGFPDGSPPTAMDWEAHVSQAWPYVRLRRTLEIRLPDGPPHDALMAAPAFWTGLLYSQNACTAAYDLLEGRPHQDHLNTVVDVARRGLRARFGNDSVAELVGVLLVMAQAGLQERVDAGLDDPEIIDYLAPLWRIVKTGETFADQQLRRWHHESRFKPHRYVEGLRVPS